MGNLPFGNSAGEQRIVAHYLEESIGAAIAFARRFVPVVGNSVYAFPQPIQSTALNFSLDK
jgi:hypothetical protein